MDGKKYKDKKKTVSAYRKKKGGKKSNKCVQDELIASTTSDATDKSTPNAEGSKKTPISTCSTSVVIPCVEEPNKVSVVGGRRIVDVDYLFQKIAKISHKPFNCNFGDLILTGERRNGFFSEFLFTCRMCNTREVIESENPNLTEMNVNTSAVMAVVNSGQGYAQLDIFSGIMMV